MIVTTPEELEGLRRAGALVAETIDRMRDAVRPGVTTADLDLIAARTFHEYGALSAPMETYSFPGSTCISVNEEVVHGIPGGRKLKEGDLVTLDVTPELDGWLADAAVTVPVGEVSPEARRLLDVADACLAAALGAARAGMPLRNIGRTVQETAAALGATPFEELCGHGIGRELHEDPTVPNVDVPSLKAPLADGLVIAVEPMLTLGNPRLIERGDGWTIATADGRLSVHVEHTIVVQDGEPIILTQKA
ncbi:type I methionyl aminopeptidase [Patulibacter minatonensis]|uniref:type I methionyl aminopeptidase n=1 Tax=Patulibacter minatonensis TaxID=298163 RepID=UPI00047986C5|nr:type I methionyl aminopeptidase [Patulibacter minatonensis]